MKKRLHPSPRFDQNLFDCQYVAALKAANMFFNDYSKSKLWMISTNPLLGNMSPVSMLRLGRYQKLLDFIYTQMSGNIL